MSYSTATFQALSIVMFIHFKSEKEQYDFLSTKVISEQLNVPMPTAVKLLNKMNAYGLTITKEGAKGGVLLARPITKITIYDVFMAVESGKPLFKTNHYFDHCPDLGAQVVESIVEKGRLCMQDAEKSFKASLSKVYLSDLLKNSGHNAPQQ